MFKDVAEYLPVGTMHGYFRSSVTACTYLLCLNGSLGSAGEVMPACGAERWRTHDSRCSKTDPGPVRRGYVSLTGIAFSCPPVDCVYTAVVQAFATKSLMHTANA